MKNTLLTAALAGVLTWATPAPGADVAQIVSPLSHPNHPLLPRKARADQCFAYQVTPAIIETITHKTELTPPRLAVDIETGETEVVRPATYKTEQRQNVIREREELFFETICPQHYTQRFVESLQRALNARGFLGGPPTGWLDDQTKIAIRLYQKQGGIDSDMLSLQTVEAFGLISHRDFEKLTGN
ncbi:MAG: peptidoglycan-binding domain-containing protein [Pseudomonadota bacterium]